MKRDNGRTDKCSVNRSYDNHKWVINFQIWVCPTYIYTLRKKKYRKQISRGSNCWCRIKYKQLPKRFKVLFVESNSKSKHAIAHLRSAYSWPFVEHSDVPDAVWAVYGPSSRTRAFPLPSLHFWKKNKGSASVARDTAKRPEMALWLRKLWDHVPGPLVSFRADVHSLQLPCPICQATFIIIRDFLRIPWTLFWLSQ